HTLLSYQNDLHQFTSFLQDEFPCTTTEEVNHSILRSWVVSLSENGLKARSINRKIIAIRSYYKFLVKRGHLSANPAARLSSLKTPMNLPNFIRQDELSALLDHYEFADNFEDIRDKLILEIFYGAGIRENELINLKENDVNF